MLSRVFYLFFLICILSQTSIYVNGSLLGDLLRFSGDAKYQLANSFDNIVDRFRNIFQLPIDVYRKEGLGIKGRVDGNVDHNINPYYFYRSFGPPGRVEGRVGLAPSASASGALLTPESEKRSRTPNFPEGSPPIFHYF